MKIKLSIAALLVALSLSTPLKAQYTKPVYISLPGPGNIQHLAYVAAKYKGFYEEMGIPNTQIVVLRGNAVNVQALVSGSVHFSSAFGPAMQTMFRGAQLQRPNFKPEQFIDDRFFKTALRTLGSGQTK